MGLLFFECELWWPSVRPPILMPHRRPAPTMRSMNDKELGLTRRRFCATAGGALASVAFAVRVTGRSCTNRRPTRLPQTGGSRRGLVPRPRRPPWRDRSDSIRPEMRFSNCQPSRLACPCRFWCCFMAPAGVLPASCDGSGLPPTRPGSPSWHRTPGRRHGTPCAATSRRMSLPQPCARTGLRDGLGGPPAHLDRRVLRWRHLRALARVDKRRPLLSRPCVLAGLRGARCRRTESRVYTYRTAQRIRSCPSIAAAAGSFRRSRSSATTSPSGSSRAATKCRPGSRVKAWSGRPPPSYSSRSATTGSTCMARRAGR